MDKPDIEKFYSYGAGFRAWFVLQHLWGYKPFLTKMVFTRNYIGNVNIGFDEINAEREKRQMDVDKWIEKEKQKIYIQPKY